VSAKLLKNLVKEFRRVALLAKGFVPAALAAGALFGFQVYTYF
jgi:hypothetical protein